MLNFQVDCTRFQEIGYKFRRKVEYDEEKQIERPQQRYCVCVYNADTVTCLVRVCRCLNLLRSLW